MDVSVELRWGLVVVREWACGAVGLGLVFLSLWMLAGAGCLLNQLGCVWCQEVFLHRERSIGFVLEWSWTF